MKSILKISSFLLLGALVLWGCKKDEDRVYYNGGKMPELSASASTISMTPIDSTKTVLSFTWSNPAYSFSNGDNSLNVTHTLEIDSVGRNFSKPQVVASNNMLQGSFDKNFVRSFTGEEFNNLLLKLGLKAGETYNIEARVSTQLYVGATKLTSNVVRMSVKPYSTEPQPLYPVPEELFIVGGATPNGWGNPVPVPGQQFTKIDKNTFGIIIPLKAGQAYLLLPKNGSWDKYAVADDSKPEAKTGTDFTVNNGKDIPAPAEDGLYKIIVDFITGKYTVTKVDASTIPANLFIIGSATAGGWNNPVPAPAQQFTKTSAYTFEITVPLKKNEFYLFLPQNNGSWDKKFAVQSKTDAAFKVGGALKVDSGEDIPSPDADGNYKIEVNFLTMSYKVTKV